MTDIIPIFPTLLIRHNTKPEFDSIKKSFVEYTYHEMSENDGVMKSNKGGWQSEATIHKRNNFKRYVEFILTHSNRALGDIFKDNIKIELLNCWLNVNNKDCMNEWHCHPYSDIAGCLWIDIRPGSGNLEFQNDLQYSQYMWHENVRPEILMKYNFGGNYRINPIPGQMVLFPANTLHKVSTNTTDRSRISFAFNLKIHMQ